jgi:hypothetical protein
VSFGSVLAPSAESTVGLWASQGQGTLRLGIVQPGVRILLTEDERRGLVAGSCDLHLCSSVSHIFRHGIYLPKLAKRNRKLQLISKTNKDTKRQAKPLLLTELSTPDHVATQFMVILAALRKSKLLL